MSGVKHKLLTDEDEEWLNLIKQIRQESKKTEDYSMFNTIQNKLNSKVVSVVFKSLSLLTKLWKGTRYD